MSGGRAWWGSVMRFDVAATVRIGIGRPAG